MQQPMTGERGEQGSRDGVGNLKISRLHPVYIKNILTIFKILAGVAMLILSIRGIQWGNLVAGIGAANLSWLALAILSVLLGLFLKIWRWIIFVKNYHIPSSISELYRAYFVGQAVNILLPFRGGELVRIGYFARNPMILPDIVMTIALEKYLDLVALAACGIIVSLKISIDNILNLRGWFLPVTILVTLILLAAILFGPAIWRKIRTGNRLPKRLIEWMDRWVQTSLWLRNPRKVFPGVLLTVLIWGVMWLTNLLLFKSLGLPLGGAAAGLVLLLVYIGLLPALMPGNIGPFYFFAWLALLPFGILHNQGLVFAIILHAIVTLPPLMGGAIGLFVRPSRTGST